MDGMQPDSDWKVFGDAREASSVVVLGNGPSLKAVDLTSLEGVPTIGLNAAYRYWHRIDWYPTYYACLDEVVVESHMTSILDLLEENRFQMAFLSGRFFELRPDMEDDPRLLNLDSVSDHWFEKRGERRRLPKVWHPAFASCYPEAITTGAWATRWAAFLGYTFIYLAGFDLNYSTDVPGVEPSGGIRLRMESTPEVNPNYFFDDYQQSGDEFQIANPSESSVPLHVEAFRVLPHDFRVQGVRTNVFSTQPESGLAELGIFPVEPGPLTANETQSVS